MLIVDIAVQCLLQYSAPVLQCVPHQAHAQTVGSFSQASERAVAVFAVTESGETRGEQSQSALPCPASASGPSPSSPAVWRGGQVSLLWPERPQSLAGAKTGWEGGKQGGSGEGEREQRNGNFD